jgi:hypothetical protein
VDRLRHWKWRLAKENRATTAASESTPPSPFPFVQVTPTPDRDGDARLIEIVAPSGFRMRVPARCDADTLRRVLAVLR